MIGARKGEGGRARRRKTKTEDEIETVDSKAMKQREVIMEQIEQARELEGE